MEIRRMRAGDIPAVMNCHLDFLEEVGEQEEGLLAGKMAVYLAEHLEDESTITYLAVEEDRLIAKATLCLYQVLPKMHNPSGRIGYVFGLYTRPEYRGKGLGIKLIGQAVSFYRKLGRTRLQLRVSPENLSALAFYRRYGFRQLPLPPEGAHNLLRMELDVDLQRDLAPENACAPV